MRKRLLFLALYLLFFIALFIFTRFAFMFYQFNLSFALSVKDWFGIFYHGFKLDLSAACYIILIPVVILVFTSFFEAKWPRIIIDIYTLVILAVIIILTLVDFEIYRFWGTRLDSTAFRFIGSPRDMLASTSWHSIILLFLALVILTYSIYWIYRRFVARQLRESTVPGWKGAVIFIIILPLLVIPIRGGIGIATMSISNVYFHKDPYPNYAAINVAWNVGHSLLEDKDEPNPFKYLSDDAASNYVKQAFAGDTNAPGLFTTNRPNVIVIVMETFTAKLVEPLGGLPGVTPNFNKLCSEGILFSHCVANDSRTDKSLVSILTGYPALGIISIIKFPNKTQKLASFPREMANAGYQTMFLYGGDVNFANLRSFLVNNHFERVISSADFDKSKFESRWGIPDEFTFQRLLDECNSAQKPFLHVFLTLSNHEPFDIPGKSKFGRNSIDHRMCSTAFYTDSCLGDFINKAKKTGWWKNTVIIMVADHGSIYPGKSIVYHPDKYKIPLLFVGGALKKDTVISTYCSQTDISKTLLDQLGLNTKDFMFSKDILSSHQHFSFYEFDNGFGMMSDSSKFVFDNDLKKIIFQKGKVTKDFLQKGQAIQQKVYDLYLKN